MEIPISSAQNEHQHDYPNPPPRTAGGFRVARSKVVTGDSTVPQLRRFQMTHSFAPVILTAVPAILANGAIPIASACRGWSDDGTKPIEKSSPCLHKTASPEKRLRSGLPRVYRAFHRIWRVFFGYGAPAEASDAPRNRLFAKWNGIQEV